MIHGWTYEDLKDFFKLQEFIITEWQSYSAGVWRRRGDWIQIKPDNNLSIPEGIEIAEAIAISNGIYTFRVEGWSKYVA